MVTFKYTGGARYRSRPTGGLTTGDTASVADADVAHFDDHDDFERVADEGGEPTDQNAGSDGGEDAAESEQDDLTDLGSVGEDTADALRAAGYETVSDVREADAETLADEVDGIGESTATDLTQD